MVMGNRGHTALAAQGTSSQARHICSGSRFIKKVQATGMPMRLFSDPLPPRLMHVCAQLLAGMQVFLKLSPYLFN